MTNIVSISEYSTKIKVHLPVVDGDTAYDPGGVNASGAVAWSTLLSMEMVWTGAKWAISGGVVSQDDADFTEGESNLIPTGGVYDDALADLISGKSAMTRLTKKRALFVNLRDESTGNYVPVALDATLVSGVSAILTALSNVTVVSAPTTAVTNAGLTNIDVALSTRLKPADTLAGVTTVGAVTAITNQLPSGTNSIGAVTVTGVATAANQTTELASLATIATNTSTSATAANQATANTNLVSIATNQTNNSQSTKITNGTQTADTVAGDTGQNSVLTGIARKTIILSGVTTAQVIDMLGYQSFTIYITAKSGSWNVTCSADNVNYINQFIYSTGITSNLGNVLQTSSLLTGSATAVEGSNTSRYIQISGGTSLSAVIVLSTKPFIPSISANMGIDANNSTITVNGSRISFRGVTANYTPNTSGHMTDAISTVIGAQITKPYSIPEAEFNYSAATGGITNTADVLIAAAAGSGLKNYVPSWQITNASATVATEVVIKDGASTVLWRGYLGVNSSVSCSAAINIANPLKSSANSAINFACITTGAQVYFNAQTYVAP